MNERIHLQSESDMEGRDSVEGAENQALREATHEPGAHIEETQNFEQAEAVEGALIEAANNLEDIPENCCPDPKDFPEGSGILEEPHESVEMDNGLKAPHPTQVIEVPEGVEFKLAGEDGTVDRDDPGMVDGSELSVTGEGDESGDEATPINLPGPVTAEVAKDLPGAGGEFKQPSNPDFPLPPPDLTVENGLGRFPGGDVSATPINLPNPVENQVGGVPGGRPGGEVSATPINLPNPVENQDDEGNNSAEMPDDDPSATPINIP